MESDNEQQKQNKAIQPTQPNIELSKEESNQDNKPKVKAYELANQLIKELHIKRIGGAGETAKLYYYTEENGFYKVISHDNELKGLIKERWPWTTMTMKKDIIENIKIDRGIEAKRNEDYIAFNNGLLNLNVNKVEDLKLLTGSHPEIIVTYKIPFDYRETNQYNPQDIQPLINAMDKWTDGDIETQTSIYEIIGYSLTGHCRMQKLFMFTGTGGTGKSTLIKLIEYIIPAEYRSGASIKNITSQFGTGTLRDKLCNLCDDFGQTQLKPEEAGLIKSISTGGNIYLDVKRKEPVNDIIFCKLIFNCNELPVVRDTTNSYERRLLIIQFNHQFTEEEKDLNIDKKLCNKEIGSYLISRAVQLYKQAELRGAFTESKSSKEALSKFIEESNSVVQWVEDNKPELETEWNNPTKYAVELYKEYEAYGDQHSIKGLYSEKNFAKTLLNKFGVDKKRKRLHGDKNPKAIFIYKSCVNKNK